MLDLQNEGGLKRLEDAIAQLKCEIEFPDSWSGFFSESGLARGESHEKRLFPRWKNRTLAGLLCSKTFSVITRPDRCHPIYLRDVSCGGAAFIHSEQLFPLEQMRLLFIDEVSSRLLQNNNLREGEVTWCRYVQRKCYEVGVRFVDV
jgi:hypothetical protein